MPTPILFPSTRPLTASELTRCQRVGTRLAAELGAMLHRLPIGGRTVREVSAFLKVDRSLYQRVVTAARERSDGCTALLRAPGVRGLLQFVKAYEKAGGDKASASAAKSVVAAMDELTRELGGSQTQLNSRIQITVAATDPDSLDENAERLRKMRYETDVQIFGVSVETRVEIRLLRPHPSDPLKFEFAAINGSRGIVAHHEGTPFVTLNRVSLPAGMDSQAMALSGTSLADNPGAMVLEEFSTTPLPKVSKRGTNQLSLLVIDAELRVGTAPRDIFAAQLVSPAGHHPCSSSDKTIDLGVSIRNPTRQLVFDVYLHRSMAQASVPSSELYFHSDAKEPFRERWYDRLQSRPNLEVRAPDQVCAALSGYPRMAELSEFVFRQMGWDASEFVGYRCQVDYPLSSAQYVIGFDFKETEAP